MGGPWEEFPPAPVKLSSPLGTWVWMRLHEDGAEEEAGLEPGIWQSETE